MDFNWGSMLDDSQAKGKNLASKGAINMLNKNVTSNERKGSPKLKKVLDILGQKQCNVKLEKLKLNTNYPNSSMKISFPVMESHSKDDNSKIYLLSSAKSLTSKKGNNLNLKSGKTVNYVETEVDLETPNIYDSSLTNGPSKDECKEESTVCYANLPARIGSYEIRVNGPPISQLTHQHFSDSISINSGKLSTNESTFSEKFPRPLSPEVLIKTFEKSSGVNKRKQRTPVKADLKSHVPANNIENPCFNFSSSKNTGQNLDDINKFGSEEHAHIKQSTAGNKVKNNSDLTSTERNFLNSSSSKLSEDSKLYKYTADTKPMKRKFQQASKILDAEPLSKKQKKKMVKFDPNISEVFKPPTDEEMIKESDTSLSTQVSGNEILDESMLKLLHSRNVQVTFQKPKFSKLSPRKLPVSKKNSRSISKSGNNVKSLSLEKEENTVFEFNPELLKGTEREKETFSPTSSFHNSSNKLGSKMDNNIFNFVYDNVKNLSDSGVLEKDGKFAIAGMKTIKVPVKSILKKRSISAKPKSNKVSSNIQIENLQQHEIENNVNAYGETSLLSNEEKSPSEKASPDITANGLSNVPSNQSLLLEAGSPTTTTTLLKNKVLPSKPSNRRGRPKSKNAKPPSSRPRKYCKKSPKKDLNVSTDTSENVEDSGSDSDDNMPIIYFLNSKAEALQDKTPDNNVSDDAILLPGHNEVLKNAKGKKKRGRGRKRQKIGRPKSIKVKDDVDADSSFVEEDDEEEPVSAAAAQSQAKRKHQKRTGRRYSVTGNWYIATGYLNDIMSLLEEFENCDGWRFKDFSKCWQKKSFSLVYRGRQTFKELLEFSEEIALLTMRFIGPSHSTKRRIGALYTLYGLYYKFPVGHFFNIRVELGEYKNLLELVHPFRSNVENPDPAYIFRKLELKGAILHCATSCEPCYDFHNEDRDLVDLEYGKQKLAKSSAVNIAVPKIQLDADSELLTYYHSVKAKLTGKGTEPEPERALSLISSEFLQTIFSDLSEMRKRTLSELGMTAKVSINSSTQGGENSNQDETDEKRIRCLGDGISRTDELNCYLHPVEGDCPASVILPINALIARGAKKVINDMVNKPTVVQKSQEFYKNIVLLRDKSVNDFMWQPRSMMFSEPLKLKVRRNITDVDSKPLNLSLPCWAPKSKKLKSVSKRGKSYKKSYPKNISCLERFLPTSSRSSNASSSLPKKGVKWSLNAAVTLSNGGSGKVVKIIEVPLSREKFQDIKLDPFKFNNLKAECKSIIIKYFTQEDYAMWHVQDIVLNDKRRVRTSNEILDKPTTDRRKSTAHKRHISKSEMSFADTHCNSLPLSEDNNEITIKEEHFEYDLGIGFGSFPTEADYFKLNRKSSDPEHSAVFRKKNLCGDNLVVQSSEGQREPLGDNKISRKSGRLTSKRELSNKGKKKNKKKSLYSNGSVAKHLKGNFSPKKKGRPRGRRKLSVIEETPVRLISRCETQIESTVGKLTLRKRGRPRGKRKLPTTGDNTLGDDDLGESQLKQPKGKRKCSITRDNTLEVNNIAESYKIYPPNGREIASSTENPFPRNRGRPRGKKKLSTSKGSIYIFDENYDDDDDDGLIQSMEVENGASDEDYYPDKSESFGRKKKTRVASFGGDNNEINKPRNRRDLRVKLIPVKVGDRIKYQYAHGVSNNEEIFTSSNATPKKKIKNCHSFSPKISLSYRNKLSSPLSINDELDSHLFFSPENGKNKTSSLTMQPDVNQFIDSENKIPPINTTRQYYFENYGKITYKTHTEGYHYSPETPEISNETVIVEAAVNNLDDCQTIVSSTLELENSLNEDELQLEINEEDAISQSEHHSGMNFVNSFVVATQEVLANTVKKLSEDWSDDESEEVSQSNHSSYRSEDASFAANQMSVLPDIDVASLKKESGNENVVYTNSQFSVSDECNLTGLNTQTGQEENLFCKVMSTDGSSVFVPVSIVSQVNSNYIEILSVKSAELDLLPLTENLENLQLESENEFVGKYDTIEPWYSHATSASQSQSISNSQPSNFQSQVLFESNPLTSIPTFSENFSKSPSEFAIPIPTSYGTSLPTFQKPLKPPSIAASSPRCSFLFSSKLKSLSNKKLASGRPPTPPPKPLVKFMWKGKSWSKKS